MQVISHWSSTTPRFYQIQVDVINPVIITKQFWQASLSCLETIHGPIFAKHNLSLDSTFPSSDQGSYHALSSSEDQYFINSGGLMLYNTYYITHLLLSFWL